MPFRQHPDASSDVTGARRTREMLASTELFGRLPANALGMLVDRVDRVEVASGEVLFRQGEPGDAMYVVVSGRLEVVVETEPGVRAVVREMGRGENLGELALLTDEPRSATIRAVRDTHLLRLSRTAFQALLRDHPETTLELTRILARWLRDANEGRRARSTISTVAVVPGSPDVDHAGFARSLAAALSPYGGALLLTASIVDEALGPGAAELEEGSAGHGRVTEWLNRQEFDYGFVVYCSEAEPSAWSRRCVRQADTVLTVVRPAAPRRFLPVAARALQRARSATGARRLVLLHPADAAPAGTGEWLAAADFDSYHHVRIRDAETTARVARQLAGRAVGVVLGGGGALGFAHVGVIRALREAGVRVDRFGGASMGALIAGMFADGSSADEVLARLEKWYARARYRPHQNRTVPIYSLDTGDQVRRMLEWDFGDVRLEDLWHPYFCLTTNLTTAESMVHREGSAVRWIEASVAIPGVVPPTVTEQGELLADGGLLNNLPADVMLAEGGGPVVAVNVAADEELRVPATRRRAPSGWAGLLGRLLPFRDPPQFPNIIRILHRSAVIGSVHSQRDVPGQVDLYLQPRLEGFDMFSWKSLRPIVEAGYRYTADRLESVEFAKEQGT